jgi:hypothetical protein
MCRDWHGFLSVLSPYLSRLYLDGVGITSLTDRTFRRFLELRSLSLNRNAIRELPPGLLSVHTKLEDVSLLNLFTAFASADFIPPLAPTFKKVSNTAQSGSDSSRHVFFQGVRLAEDCWAGQDIGSSDRPPVAHSNCPATSTYHDRQ